MKAAVCCEFGQPLVIEDVVIDPPKTGEVKVQIRAVAICHSDVHLVRGEWKNWSSNPPVIAGHEGAGLVVEVGPGVTRTNVGEAVVVSMLRSCGQCFYCTSGSPFMCEGTFALQSERRLHRTTGEAIQQGISTGAFAEYVVVDQSQVVPIAAEVPLDRACLLACGVITGYGAVVNTARVTPGSSVVVIGAGGVGLNAVQGAHLSGAYPLIAVDVLESKLNAARTFGATHTLNAKQTDIVAEVHALTSGRGADYALVTVGNPAAVEQSLKFVRRDGTIVAVGMPSTGAAASVPMGDFVYNGQRLLGSNAGSTRLNVDIPRLVGLYQSGRLKLDELITHRYPLERINDAIENMERGEAVRNVIVFDSTS